MYSTSGNTHHALPSINADSVTSLVAEEDAQRSAGRTRIAVAVAIATFASTVVSLWLSRHQNGGPIVLSPASPGEVLAVSVVLVIPYALIGGLIVLRKPGNALGWVMLGIGSTAALGLFSSTFGNYDDPISVSFSAAVAGFSEISWLPSLALLVTLLPLLFPTGRPLTKRWNWVFWLSIAGISLITIAGLIDGGWTQRERIAQGAMELQDPDGALLTVFLLSGIAILVAMLASMVSVVMRSRRARGQERDQLMWFLAGISIVVLVVVLQISVELPIYLERPLWLLTLALPLSIAIGILRHGLFDINLIVRRSVVWGSLTLFILAVYVVIVGVIGDRLSDSNNLAWSLLATGIIAALFQPVRDLAQRTVNRFVYGERDDPYAAIARLGRRLESAVSPGAMLPAIVETVAQALKLPYAAINLKDGERCALAAAFGEPLPQRATTLLPLTYHAEQVGELILAPRTPGEKFTPADMRLLNDLARQIGVAAHAVQLTTDLQRSRERLIVAREEERRRIRNDLHDGLGPVLSGLKLRAETARNLAVGNEELDRLLCEIATNTETAVSDIRRLVYSLRPPALDELGFSAAIRELGGHSNVPVAVEIPDDMPSLSAAVEVAAYRITQEALTNAFRHAGASHCSVRLWIESEQLHIEIGDDGTGLPELTTAGVGLRSIRERAAELGGVATIERMTGGGTLVSARLPLTPREKISMERDGLD